MFLDDLKNKISVKLAEENLLIPDAYLDLNIGGYNFSLSIIDGEPWIDVYKRACSILPWKGHILPHEKIILKNELRNILADASLAEIHSFGINLPDKKTKPFAYYRGRSLLQLINDFTNVHSMSNNDINYVNKAIWRKAVQLKLVPVMSVSFFDNILPSINIYLGDNIKSIIKIYSKKHKLSEDFCQHLTDKLLIKAAKAKLIPIFKMKYNVDHDIFQVHLKHYIKMTQY